MLRGANPFLLRRGGVATALVGTGLIEVEFAAGRVLDSVEDTPLLLRPWAHHIGFHFFAALEHLVSNILPGLLLLLEVGRLVFIIFNG